MKDRERTSAVQETPSMSAGTPTYKERMHKLEDTGAPHKGASKKQNIAALQLWQS